MLGAGVSCVELGLGRLAGGTGNEPSSSGRSRFSAALALAWAGFATVLGVDVGADAAVSARRVAVLGAGFFLMTGGSVTLGWLSGAAAFGASLRSFFSALERFGGRRRIWLTTCALDFENFSLTIILVCACCARLTGSGFGDLPLRETERPRLCTFAVPLDLWDASGGTARAWFRGSDDDDTEASESARFRCISSLSSSACTLEGSVGDRIVGSPYGLPSGSRTGDSSGGKPCGVELEGSDFSPWPLEVALSLFCVVEGARGREPE